MGQLSLPLATIIYLLVVRAVPDIYFVVGLAVVAVLDWVTAPIWHRHEHGNHEEPQVTVVSKPDERLVS